MPDRERKHDGNVPGAYYVDHECIDCDLCREVAPENFERNEEDAYSYVYKQPENDDETTQCREALENCPVEAIGADGGEDASSEGATATG